FALSCTIERTASRPSMADIANELQGIGHEVVGEEELSAAVKVDEEAAEMGIVDVWGGVGRTGEEWGAMGRSGEQWGAVESMVEKKDKGEEKVDDH
ncbi:unnamed protein product, partial [Closterium sp. NIES-64]